MTAKATFPWHCTACPEHGETTGTEAGTDAKHSRAAQHCTTTALTAEVAARIGLGAAARTALERVG